MIVYNNISIKNIPQNILADIYFNEMNNKKIVLFCHGFKGFKDWGAWHLVAKAFAEAGFIFVKFNFSHNGIGTENLQDFTRLDLFKQNNYTKEIEDVTTVFKWIKTSSFWKNIPFDEINIIGHSRGGGIALVSALENKEINKIATWASIANFDRFGNEENLETWKNDGFKNFYNSRTKQDMKIDFQFYENYIQNKKRLNLETTCKNLEIPLLIIHGKKDAAVGFSHAQRLKFWNNKADLILFENFDHVFGAKHPYIINSLPTDLKEVVDKTILFLN